MGVPKKKPPGFFGYVPRCLNPGLSTEPRPFHAIPGQTETKIWTIIQTRKVTLSPSRAIRPIKRRYLRFISPQPDTSLHCQTTDSASHGVSVYIQTHRERYRQRERGKDRQTVRQERTHVGTDSHIYTKSVQSYKPTNLDKTERQTYRKKERYRQTDRQTDRVEHMQAETDTDRGIQTHSHLYQIRK